jgi:hypothetical protein
VLLTLFSSFSRFPLLFPNATVSSYLLFTLGRTLRSATVLFGCFRNFPFQVGALEHLEFSACAPGLLSVLPILLCTCVWLSNFRQRHAGVLSSYCELGAFLSVLVCKVNVCIDKVTIMSIYFFTFLP